MTEILDILLVAVTWYINIGLGLALGILLAIKEGQYKIAYPDHFWTCVFGWPLMIMHMVIEYTNHLIEKVINWRDGNA